MRACVRARACVCVRERVSEWVSECELSFSSIVIFRPSLFVCLLNSILQNSLFLSFLGAYNNPVGASFAPTGAMQDMLQAGPLSILQLNCVSANKVEQMYEAFAVPF